MIKIMTPLNQHDQLKKKHSETIDQAESPPKSSKPS